MLGAEGGISLGPLFGAGGLALALIDTDGRVVACSQALGRLVGYAVSSIRGAPFLRLFDPKDHAALEAGAEARLRIRAGGVGWARVRWVEAGAELAGRELRLAIVEATTELHEARAEGHAAERRLEQIAEQIPDGFFLLSADLKKIVFASSGIVRLVGAELAAVDVPRPDLTLVHPDDQARLQEAAGLFRREPTELQFRLLHRDGSPHCWLRMRTFPLHDPGGVLTGMGGILEDVTARRHVAEMLTLARQHAARLVQAVQDPSGLLARGLEGATSGLGIGEGLSEDDGAAPTFEARIATLTPREREVMEFLVVGASTKGIAAELSLSPKTIEVYRARVMRKMDVGSIAALVRFALLRGGAVERPEA